MEFVIMSLKVLCGLIALKATLIGSEFNFYYWHKYGKRYTRWYSNRETFHP